MPDDRRAFRAAVRAGDVAGTVSAARALAPLDLLDALEVLRVLADARDPRYERWAEHWFGRVVRENRLADDAARSVQTLLGMLPDDSDARGVLVTLRSHAYSRRTWS